MEETNAIIDKFISSLTIYPEEQRSEIIAAARWAGGLHHNQKRASGEPYIIHPVIVASILVNLRLDHVTIIAALLHDVIEDTAASVSDLKKEFGNEVEALVDGVTKISLLKAKSKSVQEAETIRKMLFAMTKDIRVILIKLADKLHNMRTLEYLEPEKQKEISAECLDIYAPLAARLGISWLKDELEDLALKFLKPQVYEQIKKFVAGKRGERAAYLEKIKHSLISAAAKESIEVEVKSRAKHFYSIYHKLKKQGKQLAEVYDLLGIRVLTNSQAECYTLLGIVHKLWMPITGRFKDYIAMPKSNRYQSLHTTVMGPEGKLVEIQIRSQQMNETAENGIAAHWLYKKGFSKEKVRVEDLPLINKLKTWHGSEIATAEFLEEIKHELLRDSIYVFTPKGDVAELPEGATAIDFAYHIHTEVGNHTMGAKADGSIIPLKKPLKNAQVIEVITGQNAHPHVNWIKYAKTARAGQKIRHWLNQNSPGLITDQDADKKKQGHEPVEHKKKKEIPQKSFIDEKRVGIVINHERNILIRFSRCCNPAPGDSIIGYISRGRGITIHRTDCKNLGFIKEIDERKISVEWETIHAKAIKRFKVNARDTEDIFSEIEGAIKKYNGHLIDGKLAESGETLTGTFTIEIENEDDFKKVIKNLRTIPAIINIQPVTDTST
jgi:guanosine-3',5'-bis(diphosphate) 3'-pyrophosphohydrolase